MKVKLFIMLFFISYCISCQKQNKSNHTVLCVNLKETETSVFSLFDNIEIIPLEVTDNSLLKKISKIEPYNDEYYVLDSPSALCVFDNMGKFVRQIGFMGNGPGEYYTAYDFYIDKNNKQVNILCVLGTIYTYNLNGNFISKKRIEKDVPNFGAFVPVGNDKVAVWSSVKSDEQIRLLSNKDMKLIRKFYIEDPLINMFVSYPFHSFNDKAFFSKPLINKVYKIDGEYFKIEYEWDFGEKTLNIHDYGLLTGETERSQQIINLFMESKLPYMIQNQFQNNQFYYARMFHDMEERGHVFYNKNTEEGFYFKLFSEGFHFMPYYFHDDFIIGIGNVNNKLVADENVLDVDNYHKLKLMNEDANPFLIKYHFKK